MKTQLSPLSIAVLNYLREHGTADYLDIERNLRTAQGMSKLNHLRAGGYIQSLPKEREQLKRYSLTKKGAAAIGQVLEDQIEYSRNVMKQPPYVPSSFQPARPGAMDAFSISSRGLSA